jgi:hypothetical protein
LTIWQFGQIFNELEKEYMASGTSTELVQRFLNWNEQSKGVAVVKCVCGVLVTLRGVWLIYSAP